MAKLTLKSILRKDEIVSILTSFIEQSGSSFCVEDISGNILFGTQSGNHQSNYAVIADDEQIGCVKGDEKAKVIAYLLNHLLKKELERKKLGSEVLNLYKEINLIFNFSEKLARTIDAPSICKITLGEATQVISSNYGAIILLDENKKIPEVVASTNKLFFAQDKINNELSILTIISSGQSEIVTDTSALAAEGIILPEIQSLIYSALKVNDRVMGAIILGCNESTPYTAAHLKLLTTLALQASAAIESALLYEKNIRESKEREEAMRLVYEATGKFVPFEFIRSLGHKVITDVKLGDQVEKVVTVLFSDIRDYTTFSEQMSPEENFKFVCAFNERMGPAIRKHNGFINQYLGDAIMAIFPGNASDALSAAIDMQKEVKKLNELRGADHKYPIKIGVGMHTGPLIMGITGDLDRMDATTISDTVNIASRLESLTKHYRSGILLSDACVKQMNDKNIFHLRYLGMVQLKGKNQSLHIHECFSDNNEEEIVKKQDSLSNFNLGINHYINSSFDNAVKTFELITEDHPEDHTATFFLNAALEKVNSRQQSGIIEMEIK